MCLNVVTEQLLFNDDIRLVIDFLLPSCQPSYIPDVVKFADLQIWV